MKAQGPFGVRIFLFVVLIALVLGSSAIAQAPVQDDSPAELNQRILELYQQGKYKEAIPLAEKLVVLVRRAKGEEDPETATSLNNLALLYQAMGDYAGAEPLLKQAWRFARKSWAGSIPIRQKA